MVKNKNKATVKGEYRAAVLELIEFDCEDIVTSSTTVEDVSGDGYGENLIGDKDKNDLYWW